MRTLNNYDTIRQAMIDDKQPFDETDMALNYYQDKDTKYIAYKKGEIGCLIEYVGDEKDYPEIVELQNRKVEPEDIIESESQSIKSSETIK